MVSVGVGVGATWTVCDYSQESWVKFIRNVFLQDL